jgi:site-specific DNA recombinase
MGLCAVCAQFPSLAAEGEDPPVFLASYSVTVSRRRSGEEPDLDDDDASTACSTGVASYARFSSDMQDSRSITDQQRKCRERAASMGLEIDPALEFVDEAVSGAKQNHEGFEAMMIAARGGAIRVVLFENLSRLARDVGVTINTLKELVYGHRVRIVSIDDGIDTEINQQWEFIAVILGVQNEQYLKTLAKFVHRGQEGVVLEGLSVGDYCFGYGSVPVSDEETGRRGKNSKPKKKYVIVKEHAAWVECIFTWFVEERRSLRWITRELNRNNAPKDHRSSTPKWHHQQLSGLLSNRKYIGEWSWGRLKNERDPLTGVVRQAPRSPAEFEKWHRTLPELRIIDDSVFEKAQELLSENVCVLAETRRSDAKSGKKQGQIYGATADSSERWPRHLLSGLIFCGECDHKLYVSGRMSQYVSCPRYARGTCSCKTTLRRDLAESAILKEIMGRLTVDPNVVAALVQAAHTAWLDSNAARPTEEQSVRQKLADVTRRIEKLMDRCETEDSPELTRRLAARCTERDTLRQRLAKLTASLREAATPPTEEWVVSQLSDVRSVLSQAGPAAHAALRTLVNGRIMAH